MPVPLTVGYNLFFSSLRENGAGPLQTGAFMAKSKAPAKVKHPPYKLRISRLTIDKLGVKLYDKVSAVVAELVANAYDADAENVWIELPLNTVLARPVLSATSSRSRGEVEQSFRGGLDFRLGPPRP